MDAQQQLFNIARKIETKRSKYEYMASGLGQLNYRIITDGELNIRGKDIDLPTYVRSFINAHKEVIIIANVIRGRVLGMLLRSVGEKAFMDYGFRKGSFYGLGSLSPNFKYGDPIMLVEGAIDCDFAKQFITRDCLAIMTSSVSIAKAKVLSCLTNRVFLFLDNDEAGRKGELTTKSRLESLGVTVEILPKNPALKDLGDLLDLYRTANMYTDTLITELRMLLAVRGGKLVWRY